MPLAGTDRRNFYKVGERRSISSRGDRQFLRFYVGDRAEVVDQHLRQAFLFRCAEAMLSNEALVRSSPR